MAHRWLSWWHRQWSAWSSRCQLRLHDAIHARTILLRLRRRRRLLTPNTASAGTSLDNIHGTTQTHALPTHTGTHCTHTLLVGHAALATHALVIELWAGQLNHLPNVQHIYSTATDRLFIYVYIIRYSLFFSFSFVLFTFVYLFYWNVNSIFCTVYARQDSHSHSYSSQSQDVDWSWWSYLNWSDPIRSDLIWSVLGSLRFATAVSVVSSLLLFGDVTPWLFLVFGFHIALFPWKLYETFKRETSAETTEQTKHTHGQRCDHDSTISEPPQREFSNLEYIFYAGSRATAASPASASALCFLHFSKTRRIFSTSKLLDNLASARPKSFSPFSSMKQWTFTFRTRQPPHDRSQLAALSVSKMFSKIA